MGVNKVCGQTNIPTVDNTALDCTRLVSTKCISAESPIPLLSTITGDSLTKILNHLNEYLKGVKSDITKFESNVKVLNDKVGRIAEPPRYNWREDNDLINFLNGRLGSKQDTRAGKGLSSNDYTDEDKQTLQNLRDRSLNLNSTLDSIQSSLGLQANRITVVEGVIETLKNRIRTVEGRVEEPIIITDDLRRPTSVKLGETLQIKAKNANLTTHTEDHILEVGLGENISVNSVSVGTVGIDEQGINAGGKKIKNLAKASLTDDSREALTAGQFSVIYTEFGRQLTQHEQYIQRELDKREKIENKVNDFDNGFDEQRYPSVALLKKVRKELTDLISAANVEGKEDKFNKSDEINAINPEIKYPNLALLKKVKTDIETAMQQQMVAIRDLQDQVRANDSAVHNAEINPTTSALSLKDKHGVTIGVLNLGFLNNEGTKLAFNQAEKKLEMRNDAGDLLSSVPLGALVSNLVNGLGRDGKKIKLLDSQGVEVSEVDLTPLFNLYTPLTKTTEVETKLGQVETQSNTNKTNITSLSGKVSNLENSVEVKSNKVNDISNVSNADQHIKYPSVAALKKVQQELAPQAENTEVKSVQAANIIGNIVRVELTHKADNTKWWSVWVNGVLLPRASITFTNTMLSIDNTKVGYAIEENDELTIQYKVKRD